MPKKRLDLTVGYYMGEIELTQNIVYNNLCWDFKKVTPPAEITATFKSWGSSDVSWAVGSGIQIVGNKVILSIGAASVDKGRYKGEIKSDDLTYGSAFHFYFDIIVG